MSLGSREMTSFDFYQIILRRYLLHYTILLLYFNSIILLKHRTWVILLPQGRRAVGSVYMAVVALRAAPAGRLANLLPQQAFCRLWQLHWASHSCRPLADTVQHPIASAHRNPLPECVEEVVPAAAATLIPVVFNSFLHGNGHWRLHRQKINK